MRLFKNKALALVVALVALAAVVSVSSCVLGDKAYIEGNLTIIPRQGGDQPSLVYSACQVVIYNARTGKISQVVSFDDTGFFRAEVQPGSYMVDLYRMGSIGGTNNVPKVVDVAAGQSLQIDITLDLNMF